MDRELPTKFNDEPYWVIQTTDLHDSQSLISKVFVAFTVHNFRQVTYFMAFESYLMSISIKISGRLLKYIFGFALCSGMWLIVSKQRINNFTTSGITSS